MFCYREKIVYLLIVVPAGLFFCGCGESISGAGGPRTELGTTIGSLAEVFALESIPVEGYGLVGGLRGTGSRECPPYIRSYLKQYILAQMAEGHVDVDKLINGKDTAVVRIFGVMPAAVRRNAQFDAKVEAHAETQTTSLKGGWLYKAELKRRGSLGISTRVLATVEGPVFADTVNGAGGDLRTGYVLGGGMVRDEYKMTLALKEADYLVARAMSDVLNARFSDGTAKAVSPELVELRIPTDYVDQKQRFISIVEAVFVSADAEETDSRIDALVRELATSQDKHGSEVALEAIGNASVAKLAALLVSPDEDVRLRAGRCMLNLGGELGLDALLKIAMDKRSARRVEALEAITAGASRADVSSVAQRLLRDDDFAIRFAAYEQLRKIDDVSITQELVAGSFYLEQVTRAGEREVFVYRRGQPRIVFFGSPLYCRDNVFVQSGDGEITIDAPAGQGYVSLWRKVPDKPHVVKYKSSFELGEIVRVLCEEPRAKGGVQVQRGLNVSYAEAIGLLKQLCEKGAVAAQFHAGPLPEIE
jgi:hypothetical protein